MFIILLSLFILGVILLVFGTVNKKKMSIISGISCILPLILFILLLISPLNNM